MRRKPSTQPPTAAAGRAIALGGIEPTKIRHPPTRWRALTQDEEDALRNLMGEADYHVTTSARKDLNLGYLSRLLQQAADLLKEAQ